MQSASVNSAWGQKFAIAISLLAIAIFVLSKPLDTAVGGLIEKQRAEPTPPPEDSTPLAVQPEPPTRPEPDWSRINIGSFSLELPGNPVPDSKPGWFSRYEKAKRLDAYRTPVEHHKSHVRVSAISYSQGKLSIKSAALAAKHGIESEFSGLTTVLPFEFRNLPARQISSRRVDPDDLTRAHSYLIIQNNEMLILTVTGHDQHPASLAQQILETIELQ